MVFLCRFQVRNKDGCLLITELEDYSLIEGAAIPQPCIRGLNSYKVESAPVCMLAVQAVLKAALPQGIDLGDESPVGLRWYDARVRAAAIRMSIWYAFYPSRGKISQSDSFMLTRVHGFNACNSMVIIRNIKHLLNSI